jgi:hypothetical protein
MICSNTSMKPAFAPVLEAERKLAIAGQLSILSLALFDVASKIDILRDPASRHVKVRHVHQQVLGNLSVFFCGFRLSFSGVGDLTGRRTINGAPE